MYAGVQEGEPEGTSGAAGGVFLVQQQISSNVAGRDFTSIVLDRLSHPPTLSLKRGGKQVVTTHDDC